MFQTYLYEIKPPSARAQWEWDGVSMAVKAYHLNHQVFQTALQKARDQGLQALMNPLSRLPHINPTICLR